LWAALKKDSALPQLQATGKSFLPAFFLRSPSFEDLLRPVDLHGTSPFPHSTFRNPPDRRRKT
jgi:hypothetical protein